MDFCGIVSVCTTFCSCNSTVAVPYYVLPAHDTPTRPEQAKITLFYWNFANMEKDCSWFCEMSVYKCFKSNEPSPITVLCTEAFLFMLLAKGTFQLSQLFLSLLFQIKLLVCSVYCICTLWSCEYNFSVLWVSL